MWALKLQPTTASFVVQRSNGECQINKSHYYNATIGSANPIVRFAHRRRLEISLGIIGSEGHIRLLDFGCGDGLFLNHLAEQRGRRAEELIGYEPYMDTLPENRIKILADWDGIVAHVAKEKFSHVVCFEVLEHFSEQRQIKALDQMHGVLAADGKLIVSVPIESGVPSVVKNLFRRKREKDKAYYSFKHIMRSLLGKPIPECRDGVEYLFHMGFYFEELEKLMEIRFNIALCRFSPFQHLGKNFNSQVFYILHPK